MGETAQAAGGTPRGRDGAATRTAILDQAQRLILSYGYAGTSLDRILEAAGVTKGAFFHHFASKADLARALVERYALRDAEHLETTLARAEALARDPLQQVQIFVGLLREDLSALPNAAPGCLFASFCYEAQLLDEGTLGVIRDAMALWRRRLGAKLDEVLRVHPPRRPVKAEALADLLVVLSEGAFVVSRALRDPAVMGTQLDHYRDYLDLLFGPPEAGPAA